ncbi:unnamed protein product [Protopolystoma xenopodis]|uniref:Uncharacterized protein n=1 Tax=Protopolystoma xenopodis TaxID=117903 RepID=A0A3S5A8I4_9PLAT|nr:unnamed protein product [Protopolystoma xenopodis]
MYAILPEQTAKPSLLEPGSPVGHFYKLVRTTVLAKGTTNSCRDDGLAIKPRRSWQVNQQGWPLIRRTGVTWKSRLHVRTPPPYQHTHTQIQTFSVPLERLGAGAPCARLICSPPGRLVKEARERQRGESRKETPAAPVISRRAPETKGIAERVSRTPGACVPNGRSCTSGTPTPTPTPTTTATVTVHVQVEEPRRLAFACLSLVEQD